MAVNPARKQRRLCLRPRPKQDALQNANTEQKPQQQQKKEKQKVRKNKMAAR